MDKAKRILSILKGMVAVSKLDITLGLSEKMPNPCVCVIKDKALVDDIDRGLKLIMMTPHKEMSINNLTMSELLSALGAAMETTVLISHLDRLDHDMLILFKDPDLVDAIYHENQKEGV